MQNNNHKRVEIHDCKSKLRLVKCIKEAKHCSLLEAKNIADSFVRLYRLDEQRYSILLLNESSITVPQWEAIAKEMGNELTWEYV